MRLVDKHHRIVDVRKVTKCIEGGEDTVHAEQSIGDDQSSWCGRSLCELIREFVQSVPLVDLHTRATEPAAVDQAGVIVPVTENDIVTCDKCGHGAKVGSEAGREQQRSRSVLESRDVSFELAILWRTARDQRTRSSPGGDSRPGCWTLPRLAQPR